MSTSNDGGPAFPCEGEGMGNPHYHTPGMTLRDYFAAKAMQGMIASSPVVDRTDPKKINKPKWAEQAYGFADAMLAERAKKEAGR